MLKIAKGFSLLELMIVVAIVGILAMVAYPSYQTYVMKSRRTEAKTGLLALAQAQEEYRGENNEYADSLTKLKDAVQIRGERTLYSFVLNRKTSLQFTLTATPATNANGICPQCGDTKCKIFTLDQSGQKTATDESASPTTSDCW